MKLRIPEVFDIISKDLENWQKVGRCLIYKYVKNTANESKKAPISPKEAKKLYGRGS